MSDPANFVIIENETAKVLYKRNGADGVLYNFTDPDQARMYAMSSREVDWLNDCALGGYLVDFDCLHAIVFGGRIDVTPHHVRTRRMSELLRETDRINAAFDIGTDAYLEHMAHGWFGWDIRWGDIVEIEDYVRCNCLSHPLR